MQTRWLRRRMTMKGDFEASKCKMEFNKWVDSIQDIELNAHERTFLNILIDNFDVIYKSSASNGKRAKLLGKLVETKNLQLDKVISNNWSAVSAENSDTIIKLTRMTVESFRGFISKCDFDFSKQYTFLYGPNGSGKSSMCEALEYSLLGSIAEAETRRIPTNQYIKNQITKKYKMPQLYVISSEGNSEILASASEQNRHSFIEKNRIDQFSHISATTEKTQTERISELFGLSSFNSFVRDFTDSFDGRYLSIETPIKQSFDEKSSLYEQKRTRIEELHQAIRQLKEEGDREIKKLQEPTLKTIEDALLFIGDDSNPESLIERERSKYSKLYRDHITSEQVAEIYKCIGELLKLFESIRVYRDNLANSILDSDSLEFFNAALKLPKGDICPLCQTPISNAKRNPYVYASEQVDRLSSIANLKDSITSSAQKAKRLFDSVCGKVSQGVIALFINLPVEFFQPIDVESIVLMNSAAAQRESVLRKLDSRWSSTEEIIKDATSFNDESDKNNQLNGQQYSLLTNTRKQLLLIQGQLKTLTQELENSEQYVKEYENNNAAQLEEIKKEAVTVSYNLKMLKAYESLRKRLVKYNTSLPITLSSNLSSKAVEYYNVINADDAEFEKIYELVLPQTVKDKIMLTMEDGVSSDAMQVLSEGHIKILGLSILLAKAFNEGRKFLIFDDIVNAIDDEHRDGVASLLLQHEDFSDVQLIITCHGEQFITKLEEKAGRKSQKHIQRYMFLPADTLEERGAVIEYTDVKSPLLIAQEKLKKNELKDAAAKCRQATECLSDKLWKKLAKTYNFQLSVKMRTPKSIPDLHSVVNGLSSSLKGIQGAEELNENFIQLTSNYSWLLLNKGTHFESNQPEFERKDIRDLIDLLLRIDDMIDNLKLRFEATLER